MKGYSTNLKKEKKIKWNLEKLNALISIIYIKLLKKEMNASKLEVLDEFIKFCIVGASNTILSYAINILTIYILNPFQLKWDFIAGNIVSFLLSVLWSFYWNNKYVFNQDKNENIKESKRNIFCKIIKMYLAYGITGIILCNILSYVWIAVFGISKIIAPIINLIISVPLNYVINKFWTFKSKKVY